MANYISPLLNSNICAITTTILLTGLNSGTLLRRTLKTNNQQPITNNQPHSHPLGQTLIVTFGCGRVQRWGGPVEEIRPGDVVSILPGEKHWHGAAPTTAMAHIAVQEYLDGKAAAWLEKVSDEQYRTETGAG